MTQVQAECDKIRWIDWGHKDAPVGADVLRDEMTFLTWFLGLLLVMALGCCWRLWITLRACRTELVELRPAHAQLRSVMRELDTLRAAMEAAHDMIVITDDAGVIAYVNAAFTKVTGYPRIEAVGRPTRLLKSGEHDEAFYRQMWQTINAGRVWQGRLTNRRRDGSRYLEEQTITPVRDATGAIRHFIAIKREVGCVQPRLQERAAAGAA